MIHTVSVVNSYAAASEAVCVALLRRVDYDFVNISMWFKKWNTIRTFPTDGKPMSATLASPDF